MLKFLSVIRMILFQSCADVSIYDVNDKLEVEQGDEGKKTTT